LLFSLHHFVIIAIKEIVNLQKICVKAAISIDEKRLFKYEKTNDLIKAMKCRVKQNKNSKRKIKIK